MASGLGGETSEGQTGPLLQHLRSRAGSPALGPSPDPIPSTFWPPGQRGGLARPPALA